MHFKLTNKLRPNGRILCAVLRHQNIKMKLLAFLDRSKDEETCRNHFRDERLREVITCKECSQKTKHYWL